MSKIKRNIKQEGEHEEVTGWRSVEREQEYDLHGVRRV